MFPACVTELDERLPGGGRLQSTGPSVEARRMADSGFLSSRLHRDGEAGDCMIQSILLVKFNDRWHAVGTILRPSTSRHR